MDLKKQIESNKASFDDLKMSPQSDEVFKRRLKERLHDEHKNNAKPWLRWSIAASLILALGLFYFISRTAKPLNSAKMALINDLEASSTGTRLEAVYKIEESFEKEDEQIIDILLQTLYTDSNANVKIASIEALLKFPNNEKIRLGMIEALKKEDQPIVQIKLINSLSSLRETRAKKPLEDIINNQNSFDIVKSNAHLAMSELND